MPKKPPDFKQSSLDDHVPGTLVEIGTSSVAQTTQLNQDTANNNERDIRMKKM